MPVALYAETLDGDDGSGGEQPERHACLHVSVVHNLRWSSSTLLSFESVGCVLHPLHLQLEQNLAARILRCASSLVQAAAAEVRVPQSRRSVADRRSIGVARELSTATPPVPLTPNTEVPIELYFKELKLHPVSVRCTVQMEAVCTPAELQPYHPTNSLVGLAQRLVSLNNAHLQLSALLLNDAAFQSMPSLVERISWHYTMQALAKPRSHPCTAVPPLASPPLHASLARRLQLRCTFPPNAVPSDSPRRAPRRLTPFAT